MPERPETLTRYTIAQEHRHPGSSGEFSALLNVVATATKIIANQVTRGRIGEYADPGGPAPNRSDVHGGHTARATTSDDAHDARRTFGAIAPAPGCGGAGEARSDAAARTSSRGGTAEAGAGTSGPVPGGDDIAAAGAAGRVSESPRVQMNSLGDRGPELIGADRATAAEPRRLDAIANDIMVAESEWTGPLAGLLSEQMSGFHPVPTEFRRGKYLLAFDPLDGSSNIDVNLPVGTIFSVLRCPDDSRAPSGEDFLQPGVRQVCAGFTLYGPATMLVLTTGDGVDGFTLDREIGAFVLTHPRMRIPEGTSGFAINAANERFWEPPVRRYVHECLAGVDGPRGRDFNMRWVASLVADTFHILTRGGVYLYPFDTRSPGRVSLLYGANPIAFVVEQAGGAATTGHARVLEVSPRELHQRVPLIFGSRREVERIARYHREPEQGPRFDASLFGTRSLFRSVDH